MDIRHEFYLLEYEKLKDEQHMRIQFRDNLTYLTLGAVGTVFTFLLDKDSVEIAFLVLPFVCLIMGWTYIRNDQKISQISCYVTDILLPALNCLTDEEKKIKISWDAFRIDSKKRNIKKRFQLYIDLVLFCGSAITSITAFLIICESLEYYHILIIGLETISIYFVGWQIIRNYKVIF